MEFQYYYYNFEKIKFLNFEIDDEHNLKLFQEIEKITELAAKHKLNILFTGSWGNAFCTNKIYRTLKDIDFCADKQDYKLWYDILKINNYNFIFDKIFKIKNYVKHQISRGDQPVSFVNSHNKKLNIEIFFKDFKKIKQTIFVKKIGKYNIKYIAFHKIFVEENLNYRRKKDENDINFYSQYVNFEEMSKPI